jgi:parallel beta-helix repeat protein
VENNTVNDKPLVYLENASDYEVEDAGQVILVNCNNITVENLDLSNTSIGVALLNTGNSIISNNTVRNNSRKGIYLLDSSSNTITCNNVYNNKVGISISADDNLIYLNNFIDNTINDFWPGNIWNSPWKITYIYNGTTYTSNLGNYWDDYEEKYPDSEEIDTTGIWDTQYNINSDKDTYPLTMRSENYIILTQKECEVDVNNIHYDWYESLSWIKENTPDPCVDYYVSFPGDKTYPESAYSVMSWCDYGNWITCIAHRIPVANNINNQQTNSQVAATFFITSNESEANEVADAFDVRYVVSAFPMADAMSSYQNLFGEIAFCANDTTGRYTLDKTEWRSIFELREEYFKTMVTRLHMFDGTEAEFKGGYLGHISIILIRPFHTKPLRHYRLVHESSTYMIPYVRLNRKTDDMEAWNCYVGKNYTKAERLAYRLHHGFTDHTGPNLVRWTPPFFSAVSSVKVFEYVKGARIKGRAPNGSTVMIATNITTNQGRVFMYSQMAISNGTYEFVVPYSTEGPIDDGTNFEVLAAHYVLRAGHIENETIVWDTMKEVEVVEDEVMEGKTVRVDLV